MPIPFTIFSVVYPSVKKVDELTWTKLIKMMRRMKFWLKRRKFYINFNLAKKDSLFEQKTGKLGEFWWALGLAWYSIDK